MVLLSLCIKEKKPKDIDSKINIINNGRFAKLQWLTSPFRKQ